MENWISLDTAPITADVVRWTEPVFHFPKRKSSRPVKIGSREVIAEVTRADGVWVELLVRDCKKISEDTMRTVEVYKTDTIIKRKSQTFLRNKPYRLRWSEEGARESVVSSRLT